MEMLYLNVRKGTSEKGKDYYVCTLIDDINGVTNNIFITKDEYEVLRNCNKLQKVTITFAPRFIENQVFYKPILAK